MLETEPAGADQNAKSIWCKLKPLSIELFERYWRKVEPNLPLFDVVNAEYQEWRSKATNIRYFGMRHKVTGKEHGIVRIVVEDGWIKEESFLNGKIHGLSVSQYENDVEVILDTQGKLKAKFEFDHLFNLTKRVSCDDKLLDDL